MTPPGTTAQSRPIGHSIVTVDIMTTLGATLIAGAIIEGFDPLMEALVIDVPDNIGGDGGFEMPSNAQGTLNPDGSTRAAEKPVRTSTTLQIPIVAGVAVEPWNGCYFDGDWGRGNERFYIESWQPVYKANDYWKGTIKLRRDPSF